MKHVFFKMVKSICLMIFFLAISFSCIAQLSKIEEKIINKVHELPEVQERAKYVEKETNGQRQLRYVIWKKPTKKINYYWVKVMEDNGLTYYTHFNFYVTSDLTIMYYDVVKDTLTDLSTWRKNNN